MPRVKDQDVQEPDCPAPPCPHEENQPLRFFLVKALLLIDLLSVRWSRLSAKAMEFPSFARDHHPDLGDVGNRICALIPGGR